MSELSFDQVFLAATGKAPYDYQCRLACGIDAANTKPETLTRGAEFQSLQIGIPTGLGKTAAVVLAWLWNRVLSPDREHHEKWARRLIYCLPMRTLVEQTRDAISGWLANLVEKYPAEKFPGLSILSAHSPVILMGGEENDGARADWDIHPGRPTIIIGTQDMLLSRALNRGYGMSRSRWSMHFGLLNNDALWVMDETQLMGAGVRTAAQLSGFRDAGKIGAVAPNATWWVSATLDSRLLVTPDQTAVPPEFKLTAADHAVAVVADRVNAKKKIAAASVALAADDKNSRGEYLAKLAEFVLEKHQRGQLSLVILNRVNRARDLYAVLQKSENPPPLLLIHSRFRPSEREKIMGQLKAGGEKIIVATQAVEAGVDISARVLITELAPWSSLVQRFGRCNRYGEFNALGGAEIFLLDLASDDKIALPYTPAQFDTARERLMQLGDDASPARLEAIAGAVPADSLPATHILRRKDLIELFDTSADIAGLDLDIARYIREDDSRDVQVFWREIAEDAAPTSEIRPTRRELVRVAIGDFKKFSENQKTKNRLWRWDFLDKEWQSLSGERLAPGQIYLAAQHLGGYDDKLGWTGENKHFPPLIPPASVSSAPHKLRCDETFQTLAEHTGAVERALAALMAKLPSAAPWAEALTSAAKWHDTGKAHPVFQAYLRAKREVPPEFSGTVLAKSPRNFGVRYSRSGFRHELASALAYLQSPTDAAEKSDLAAYLIAAHHGKVRLSLRALPNETPPPNDVLYARGVWDGDKISVNGAEIVLDLSPMRLGADSWLSRILRLRDTPELGVFRLTFLETLLRAADAIASQPTASNDKNSSPLEPNGEGKL